MWQERPRTMPHPHCIGRPILSHKEKPYEWPTALPILIHPDAKGFPEIETPDQVFKPQTPSDLLNFLLCHPRIITLSKSCELHSLLKVFGPALCQSLSRHKRVQYEQDGIWIDAAGDYSIKFRKGNHWYHVANFRALADKDWDPDIQEFKEKTLGFFQALYDHVLRVGNPSSPGNIGQYILLQHAGAAFPDLYEEDIPMIHIERAYNCYKGGRMEGLTIGHLADVCAYDFTSQYPSIFAELLSCMPEVMEWRDAAEYVPEAYYGSALIEVECPERSMSPLCVRIRGHLRFPHGEMEVWLPKPEIDLLRQEGIPFRVIQGSWGIPRHHCYPFRKIVQHLYDLREKYPLYSTGFKRVSNAMIGKLASAKSFWSSKSFCPIYASHVLSEARVRLYRTVRDLCDEKDVVGLTVDGFLTRRQIAGVGSEKIPGQLRFEGRGEGLMATDFLKDRPGKHRWRSEIEATARGNGFTYRVPGVHGLSIFAMDHTPSAHDKLGTPTTYDLSMPVGSFVRRMDGLVARDILVNNYPTSSFNIQEALGYNTEPDWFTFENLGHTAETIELADVPWSWMTAQVSR